MKFLRLLGLLLFVSCKEEPAPRISALRFPVVVLFSSSSSRVCRDAGELTNMHTNYLTLNSGAPVLIDSEFKIYSLDHFQSTHGGLWLMAHPSAMTEVTFELKSLNVGRENARELFVSQLEKQSWRDDLESRKKTLPTKQKLLEMAALLEN